MSMVDVDTRSDVYSLGVLLYELLTGTTPFEKERLKRAPMDEVRRIIREEEPPRPSTRISTLGDKLARVSANCKTEPKKLGHLVRGELDWIVMKALEKDRGRRYETLNGFAADVQRYLQDETVEACPPSAVYRLRKFTRRHKAALAAATAVAAAILLVVGTVGWAARDRLVRRAALAQEIRGALEEAEREYRGRSLLEAEAAVRRAEVLSAGGGLADEPLRGRIRNWRAHLKMVTRLETIRLGEGRPPDVGPTEVIDGASLFGRSTGMISVTVRNADGTYQNRVTYPAGPSPGAIAAGDFNGDGWTDIVVVNSLSSGKSTFAVLLNDGNW
jgi:hypothetical protein